jgi:hypothetical protein
LLLRCQFCLARLQVSHLLLLGSLLLRGGLLLCSFLACTAAGYVSCSTNHSGGH